MAIGATLRSLRVQKGLSQGDIEKRTGLLRCYISRIENEHTVPSLETLERLTSALHIPMYELFHSVGESATPDLNRSPAPHEIADEPGQALEDARFLMQMKNILGDLAEPDREVLLTLARKLATR